MAYLWQEMEQDVTWDDAAWLAERTSLPVIAKGVMTVVEARNAVDAGCRAVVVPTRAGGSRRRTGDDGRAARDGRRGRRRDRGARRRRRPGGHPRVKALALGARCVLIGRPIYWGLAAGGGDGVRKVLELMVEELRNTMQLAGVNKASAVPRDLVVPASDPTRR